MRKISFLDITIAYCTLYYDLCFNDLKSVTNMTFTNPFNLTNTTNKTNNNK